ncbi:hypothetical protein LMG31506_01696 [Cupriavidus yeoncheonensis]|uniref:DUF1311 domain-containing protein n=1 Tax=Cupriavidus yeoncheonensis TaxID=1462994 RepID=A0A916N2V1_9BURK|nr:hypothetical protein [Cupriavidus yeoncheonensis]CAG2136644.1 hypothetical protein LMG31506_01696 [Cupriavidus yeoncheonensis]
MSRQLAVMMVLLAASGLAQAVTKCQNGSETLYTSASCPAGYRNVTGSMRSHVMTVPGVAKNQEADRAMSALRMQAAAQNQADEEMDLRAQNAFWNQCLVIDYRVRATERAMQTTEYWSYADRYREHADALRALQYGMGCLG